MKKAILIGKFNDITKEISSYLATRCQVQLSSDNKEILIGMLQMTKPDLIVLLLTGISMSPGVALSLLTKECPNTPIIVVGNQDDEAALSSKGYLDLDWLRYLRRPVTSEKICKYADILLNLDMGNAEEEKAPEDTRPTVLLVDDSPTMIRSMQGILSRKYKVNFATSGYQAISAISKSRPDIILLDYEMPVCDGRMTLHMLRSEESTKDIPVVFLTGISDFEHVVEAMELRPQGYLLKPCAEEKLFSTIDQVLKESKGADEDAKE